MKKFLKTLFCAAIFSSLMIPLAFADVAAGPMIATIVGIPVLIIAVVIIAVVVVVRIVKRNKK